MVEWERDFEGNQWYSLGRLQGSNWCSSTCIQRAHTFLWWGP